MSHANGDVLTARQEQIADGIRRGLSYAEIAGELTRLNQKKISPLTIRTHVQTMAARLRPLVIVEDDEDEDNFAPREIVSLWVRQRKWAADRGLQPLPIPTA